MQEQEEKVTLTQRRSGRGRSVTADKLDRSRLQMDDFEEDGSSPVAVIVWILLIVIIAAAAFFGVRSFFGGETGTDTPDQVAPTATPDPAAAFIKSGELADASADSLQPASAYGTLNQQVGAASEAQANITDTYLQKYTTFTRVTFETDATTLVSSTYSADSMTVDLDFANTADTSAVFDASSTINVPTSIISSVTKSVQADSVRYTVDLNEATTFVLHQSTNSFYFDVKELSTEEQVVTDPETDVVEPTLAPTSAPTSSTGSSTSFSQSNQTISSGLSQNVYEIYNFKFNQKVDVMEFWVEYRGGTAGEFPTVTAEAEDGFVVLKVNNVQVDRILGNGGTGGYDFTQNGVTGNTRSMTMSHASNATTYKLSVQKATDFRILKEADRDAIKIEIKHN